MSKSESGMTQMVWTCVEKRCWFYQEKKTKDGAVWQAK